MKEVGMKPNSAVKPRLYIAPMGRAAASFAFSVIEKLRADGIYAECDIMGRSLKAQMKYADKIGTGYTLIIGDSELESGSAILKNMETGGQTEVKITFGGGDADIDALRLLLG